jgi:hypothetical protein
MATRGSVAPIWACRQTKKRRPIGKNVGVTLMGEDYERRVNTLHTALRSRCGACRMRSSRMQYPEATPPRGRLTRHATAGAWASRRDDEHDHDRREQTDPSKGKEK